MAQSLSLIPEQCKNHKAPKQDGERHEKVFSFQQLLTTIEHWGGCEKEQPKVGPKGEEVGTSESKDTESTEVGQYRQIHGQQNHF